MRTRIVSTTIDHAQGSPIVKCSQLRTWRRRCSSGLSGLATIIQGPPESAEHFLGYSCVVHSSVAPGVAASQAPSRFQRALDRPILPERVSGVLRARRVVLAGRRARDTG